MLQPHDAVSNYDDSYVVQEQIVARLLDSANAGLPQVLTVLERENSSSKDETAERFGYVFGNQVHMLPTFGASMALWMHRLFAREFLLRHIPTDCDQIIELGAGYGPNLFYLQLGGGPANAEYCCLEPSLVARRIATQLATLTPMRFSADTVDIGDIELGPIIRGKKVFVFTCGTAIVLRRLPENFFAKLTADRAVCAGAHIEPGSWQLDAASGINRNARDFTLKYGRNENLFPLLMRAQTDRIIHIEEFIENNHSTHALAPFSLVAWSRARS